MKAYLALSAAFAIAACSPSADAEAEAETEAPVEAAALVANAGVAAGDYTVDYGERTGPFSIDADGNWTSTDEDGNEVTGTSAIVDGKICFTNTGEEQAECWTNDPAAEDGSFSSTNDTGETVTVTPVS